MLLFQTILQNSEFSSASPGAINRFIGLESPADIEAFDVELQRAISEAVSEQQDLQSSQSLDVDTGEAVSQLGGAAAAAGEGKLAELLNGNLSQAKQLTSIASNPTQALLPLLAAAGPAGAIVIAALSAPGIIDRIVQLLISPGGPFDRRLKIILENQEEQFLNRVDQKRREIGLDQVIISQFDGFGNAGGRLTVNTLNQVRENGTSEIGLNEIAVGLR